LGTTPATPGPMRRGLYAVFALTAAAGAAAALPATPATPATAATDPCAASEVAKTVGSVATSMGTYLDGHPQTNQALTTLSQQQGGPQSLVSPRAYLDANPQVGKDMQQLQQPLVGLSSRCKLPLTLPQVMGLMQAAQGGGLPAGLPASSQPAQAPGLPAGAAPVQSVPRTASAQATSALPGPAIAGLP